MITFYGWGPMFGCPSPSPFVMKSDIQLQMLGVDFTRAIADLDAVPKHKAPYVIDDGQLIEDSNFIRHHYEAKLGKGLYDGMRGKGLGAFLLMDALNRILLATQTLAIHAVVIDAKDDAAAAFYRKYGFISFMGESRRLFLPMATIRRLIEA